jgi:hypothetical protein
MCSWRRRCRPQRQCRCRETGRRRETMSTACELNVSLMRRAVAAHDHRQTRADFSADDSDLDLAVTGAIRHHGSETPIEKIDVLDPPAFDLQLLAQREIDGLESGCQQTMVSPYVVLQRLSVGKHGNTVLA